MRKLSDQAKLIILVSAFAILLLISIVFAVVSKQQAELNKAEGESMLIVIGKGKANKNEYTIVYDIDTGVEYILTQHGVTPLLQEEGKPKIYYKVSQQAEGKKP